MLNFDDGKLTSVDERKRPTERRRRRNSNRMETSDDSPQGFQSDSPKAEGRNIQIDGAVTSSILVTGNDNQITINAAPAEGTPREATLNLLSSQIETLSADLSEEKAIRLEELREQFRAGAMQEAYEAVEALY